MSDREDYRERLTRQIIEALEAGTRPWDSGVLGCVPLNGVTGRRYQGMNALYLNYLSMERGYEDPRWLTYRQARAHGWQVRRGEKSAVVEYWDWRGVRRGQAQAPDMRTGVDDDEIDVVSLFSEPHDAEADLDAIPEQRRQPRVFYSYVFNAAQIDGIPALSMSPIHQDERYRMADAFIDATGARIIRGLYPHAGYSVAKDVIYEPAAFKTPEDRYATVMHELGHWTGHSERLNRPTLTSKTSRTDYAKEELRAEIASAMLTREFGIEHDLANHASYLESYLEVLANDKHEIFRAARDADRISDYLLQFAPQEVLDFRECIVNQVKEIAADCAKEEEIPIHAPPAGVRMRA